MSELFDFCKRMRWTAFYCVSSAILLIGTVKYAFTYLSLEAGLIGLAVVAVFTALTFGWRPFKRTTPSNVTAAATDGGRS